MANWSIEAIVSICTIIGSLIGGAVVWISTKGLDSWIRWRDARLTEREREVKLKQLQRKPFDSDQVWEDKNLAMGYKALLYSQDKRLRELEDKDAQKTKAMAELHSAHMQCLQEHAESAANYQSAKAELDDQKRRYADLDKRYVYLEKRLEKLRRKSNIELDDNSELE